MLDIAVVKELVDRLIGLIRERHANRRTVFQSHVQPIYDRMLEVRADLDASFADLERVIDGARSELGKGHDEYCLAMPVHALYVRRERMQQVREELRRYLIAFRSAYGMSQAHPPFPQMQVWS